MPGCWAAPGLRHPNAVLKNTILLSGSYGNMIRGAKAPRFFEQFPVFAQLATDDCPCDESRGMSLLNLLLRALLDSGSQVTLVASNRPTCPCSHADPSRSDIIVTGVGASDLRSQ